MDDSVAVIAIYSLKGGVGKTTMAFELAWRFATIGAKRTLLWDLDVQGGSAFLLDQPYPKPAVAAGAFKPGGAIRQLVRPTRYANLHLLPADDSLRVLPNMLALQRQPGKMAAIANLLSTEFDRIVVDCPPALNEISDQIIAAASVIVVPLPPSPLAMRAFGQIRGELLHNHYRQPPLIPVLSMFDKRRKLHRDIHGELARDWQTIPLAAAIEKVAQFHAPVESFAPRSASATAFADLAERIDRELASQCPAPPRMSAPAPDALHISSQSPAIEPPVARLQQPADHPGQSGSKWRKTLRWLRED